MTGERRVKTQQLLFDVVERTPHEMLLSFESIFRRGSGPDRFPPDFNMRHFAALHTDGT